MINTSTHNSIYENNILDKNKITSTLNTTGNVDIASPNQTENIKTPPDTIDESG